MLEKDDIKKYITGYKFDLNPQSISNIVDDKYALYEVLKNNNIPVIDHNIIYSKKIIIMNMLKDVMIIIMY